MEQTTDLCTSGRQTIHCWCGCGRIASTGHGTTGYTRVWRDCMGSNTATRDLKGQGHGRVRRREKEGQGDMRHNHTCVHDVSRRNLRDISPAICIIPFGNSGCLHSSLIKCVAGMLVRDMRSARELAKQYKADHGKMKV